MLLIYAHMLSKTKQLEKQIQDLQSRLKEFPDGKLICTRNGEHYKWYQTDGATKTYIPKKNRVLAEQLAVKKYLSSLLEDLIAEHRAIQFYLRHHQTDMGKARKLLLDNPEYQKLLKPYFQPLSQELASWMTDSYETNSSHPEQLNHKCSSGHLVRSKSESMIDTFLHINKIPFRYECALQLGENTLFPDFTIRHPKTGDVYYWEHFGLMDNPSYSSSIFCRYRPLISHSPSLA